MIRYIFFTRTGRTAVDPHVYLGDPLPEITRLLQSQIRARILPLCLQNATRSTGTYLKNRYYFSTPASMLFLDSS